MKRKIGITLVTLGLILILFAVALFLYNNFENKKAQEQELVGLKFKTIKQGVYEYRPVLDIKDELYLY